MHRPQGRSMQLPCGRGQTNVYVDPTHIKPLLASRLIALDKNSGVRPIGIGDMAKISGIEAAVHAVRSAFESTKAEAILLVDATNGGRMNLILKLFE